jgi:carbon storage regulator CsrA
MSGGRSRYLVQGNALMPNLVLCRRANQSLTIDGPCCVTVLRIRGGNVTIAIEADRDVKILRGELQPHAQEEIPDGSDSAEPGQPEGGQSA